MVKFEALYNMTGKVVFVALENTGCFVMQPIFLFKSTLLKVSWEQTLFLDALHQDRCVKNHPRDPDDCIFSKLWKTTRLKKLHLINEDL